MLGHGTNKSILEWEAGSTMRTGDREPIPTVSEAVREAAAICDPNGGDTPAAQMTVAAAIWLSTNRDQEHHHREHVLRESSRLSFHGDPPPDVAEWLREAGVG